MTTIAKDIFIIIFIAVRSLNIELNITKLIANDTANMVIAIKKFIITKNIIPNTKQILEHIAITFIIFTLICDSLPT